MDISSRMRGTDSRCVSLGCGSPTQAMSKMLAAMTVVHMDYSLNSLRGDI